MASSETPAGVVVAAAPLLTEGAVKAERDRLVAEVFAWWSRLRAVALRHEGAIQKRWVGKSKPKRRAILCEAWPGMAEGHRPDLAQAKLWMRDRSLGKTRLAEGDDVRDAYMMPYINLEDLSAREPLLVMINARAWNEPHDFADGDVLAYEIGTRTGALELPAIEPMLMMFRGRTTAETYGQIYKYGEGEADLDVWSFSYQAQRVGDGLNCLRIQARIYHFLVRCCYIIMQGKEASPSSMALEEGDHEPEPPVPSANKPETSKMSLAVSMLEGAYQPPAPLDLARMELLVRTKLAEAEDRLLSLREDPGFFAHALFEEREHRPEHVLDKNGKPSPLIASTKPSFWSVIVRSTMALHFDTAEFWRSLHSRVVKLKELMDKHARSIDPAHHLPEDLAKQFAVVLSFLNEMSIKFCLALTWRCVGAPKLRAQYVRTTDVRPDQPVRCSPRPADQTQAQHDLISHVGLMTNDQRSKFTIKRVVDSFNRVQETKPEVNKLLTSYLADRIADVSVIGECIDAITKYVPWAENFDIAIRTSEDELIYDAAEGMKYLANFILPDSDWDEDIAGLGAPTRSKFDYPVHLKRTPDTMAALARAETSLDTFWNKYINRVNGIHNAKRRYFSPGTRALIAQPHRTGGSSSSGVDGEDIVGAIAELLIGASHRDTSNSAGASSGRNRGPHICPPSSSLAAGDKRARKVLDVLFPSAVNGVAAVASGGSGETKWSDFEYVMIKAGFMLEKQWVSGWLFTPDWRCSTCTGNPIMFSEPYPEGKIDIVTARHIGRRLAKAYGWRRDMVLQD
ncbi:hypothetical protein B0T24DRAFT_716507 [Lasiosphaeria ovina]|uniref:Uncharacterized protein n=1 Tax=Lasiosphaeria ovina TaxID=92902 RepID=A0AAE0KLE8_9PEZI|nr:hypothetical protein B0T24DRAFT_716507 [Lasiosphaeria ovina]